MKISYSQAVDASPSLISHHGTIGVKVVWSGLRPDSLDELILGGSASPQNECGAVFFMSSLSGKMDSAHGKPLDCSITTLTNSQSWCMRKRTISFWRRHRSRAHREKKARRVVAQAQLNSCRTSVKHKFGVKAPKNHQQAMQFDEENKNDFWVQAERLEIWELQSLNSFRSIGKKSPP